MASNLDQLCADEGTGLVLGANRSLWLDDPDRNWLVTSGYADVFAVPRQDGVPVGTRQHLFRVPKGEALFGIHRAETASGVGFLAVGTSETALSALPLVPPAEFSPAGPVSPELAQRIDAWVTHWYEAVCTDPSPKEFTPLEAGGEVTLTPGQAAQPRDAVVWVKSVTGSARLADLAELTIPRKGSPVPLSEPAWLRSTDEVRLGSLDTTEMLRQGDVWSALGSFYALMRLWLDHNATAYAEAEDGRLRLKAESQRRTLQSAVGSLAGVLGQDLQTKPLPATERDALLTACRIIGAHLKVEFRPPPAATAGDSIQDPLSRIANASRVRKRRIVLAGDWWRRDGGPLLAYVDSDGRPVALMPTGQRGYEIVDPTDSNRRPVTAQSARLLKQFAYTFYRPFPEHALTVLDVLKFGLAKAVPDILMVVLMGGLAGVFGILTPIGTGLVFDSIIPSAERSQLLQLTLGLLAAAFAIVLFDLTRSIALLRVETKSDASIQAAVWDRLLSLPVPFFRDYTTGDLADRAGGINAIRAMLSGAVMGSILSGVFSIFNFALLFYYSFELAWIAAGLVAVNLAATLGASLLNLRLQRPLYAIQGKISGLVLQLITGISKLRVAGAERHGFAVWTRIFSKQKRLDMRVGTLFNVMDVFHSVFPVITSIVLFAAMALWLEQGLSTGKFLAFNAAFGGFLGAVLGLSQALFATLDVIPIYERAKPILTTLPEVDESRADPGELIGRIEVNHLFFAYSKDGPTILDDITFQVAPGEFVAIVGSSGSGKSTLFRLLLGFETPTAGAIYYDGKELGGLDLRALRRQFGVVLQQARIIPGSIFENIVGSSLLTQEDAWEAAEKAGLKPDVEAMPMGMHTFLGEGAGTLSGGQRQRLIIARAIVHRPRVILFDEATSALDNRTQGVVSESLASLRATRIVIAHRLSTIENADRILVVQSGRLVQTGTYAELTEQPGPFAEMAKRQVA